MSGLQLAGICIGVVLLVVSGKRKGLNEMLLGLTGAIVFGLTLATINPRMERLKAEAFEKGMLEGGRVGVLDHKEGKGFSGPPMYDQYFVRLSDGREIYEDIAAPRIDGTAVVSTCYGTSCKWEALAPVFADPVTEEPPLAVR